MCRFWRSGRTEIARCCVLVYLGRVRVDTGRVWYLRVVNNISLCDLISVVQVLDLFNIVYNCFSDYLCVEFFICLENSSSNRFRILSSKFSETPIHTPSRRILGPFNLQLDRREIQFDTLHLVVPLGASTVPSGVSKLISEHMVCSMQTMHLSCIKIITISK